MRIRKPGTAGRPDEECRLDQALARLNGRAPHAAAGAGDAGLRAIAAPAVPGPPDPSRRPAPPAAPAAPASALPVAVGHGDAETNHQGALDLQPPADRRGEPMQALFDYLDRRDDRMFDLLDRVVADRRGEAGDAHRLRVLEARLEQLVEAVNRQTDPAPAIGPASTGAPDPAGEPNECRGPSPRQIRKPAVNGAANGAGN